MKLLRATPRQLQIAISHQEKRHILDILSHYYSLPEVKVAVSNAKNFGSFDECQKMLWDAMAEQRAHFKFKLDAFRADTTRFQLAEDGAYTLSLSPAEVHWLIQVVNEIKVCAWQEAGCPDELVPDSPENPEAMKLFILENQCQWLQHELLRLIQT